MHIRGQDFLQECVCMYYKASLSQFQGCVLNMVCSYGIISCQAILSNTTHYGQLCPFIDV